MSHKLYTIADAGVELYDALTEAGLKIEGELIVRLQPEDFFRLETLVNEHNLFKKVGMKADGHIRTLHIFGIRYETTFKKVKYLPDGRAIPSV